MATRSIRLPERGPLFRRRAAGRPWRGRSRSLVSLLLLLTFLHSVLLPGAPSRSVTPAGKQTVLRTAPSAHPPAEHPVPPGAQPFENAADEEGDSGEHGEPDKDFLADQTAPPHFSRQLLKQLGYGEPAPGSFCSPLPGFSPPPERVS